MSIANQTLFLAGATGMTGTSLLETLRAHSPTTRIRAAVHQTEPDCAYDDVEYVQGDLRNLEDCRWMVAGCDCAIMAAAYAGGAAYTTNSPFEHMRENLLMNRQMLEAFHLEGVKRIVFIGSAVIYQAFEGRIKEEQLDFNKDPHWAYFGFSQAMRFLENMCRYLHKEFDHEVVMVRAANIFGPRDKFELDENALDQLNQKLGEVVLADGRFLVGTSKIGPRTIFRPAFSNWRTRKVDVEELAEVVLELGKNMS